MAPIGENSWERWRGEHEARVSSMEDDVQNLWRWRAEHEAEAANKYQRILERLTSVETKLVFFAAMAAAIGAMMPGVLAAIAKRL